MTSNKPYLVRAFYDWISDNQLTPYIVVDVNVYGALVPQAYVSDGQIVLNISAGAVGSIALGPESIELSARFGGKLEHIVVPYGAIGAIYAKENGVGTALEIEHPVEQNVEQKETKTSHISLASKDDNELPPSTSKDTKKGKPSLKVIK